MFNLRFLTSPTVRTIKPALTDSFSDREIELMADLGSLTHVSSGDELISEGSRGTHAYLITAGSAAVQRDDEIVAMLSKGDMVGERALVTREPRNATVTARMPISALRFDRHQFSRLRSESPTLRDLSDDLVAARS